MSMSRTRLLRSDAGTSGPGLRKTCASQNKLRHVGPLPPHINALDRKSTGQMDSTRAGTTKLE